MNAEVGGQILQGSAQAESSVHLGIVETDSKKTYIGKSPSSQQGTIVRRRIAELMLIGTAEDVDISIEIVVCRVRAVPVRNGSQNSSD